MKTNAATTHFPHRNIKTATLQISPAQRLRALSQDIRQWVEAVTNFMRLVRAYNDLERLPARTLQDIGTRPGELDRILDGNWKRSS